MRIIARLTLIILVCRPAALTAQDPSPCYRQPYRGFDSRLTAEAIGLAPLDARDVRGFEIVSGRPVVALSHRLIGLDGNQPVFFPSLDVIDGIAVDDRDHLWVQTGESVRRFVGERLESVRALRAGVVVHDSGHALLAESSTSPEATQIVLRSPEQRRSLPPLVAEGRLTAMSWNQAGLAAIVDSTLITWPAGAKSATRLYADVGLANARDVCLLSPTRAIIALQHVVVLIDKGTVLVLAVMPARVRQVDGIVYLLEPRSGIVWRISGIDKVGDRDGDRAHATRLLTQLPKDRPENDLAFLEAARIVGCEGARKIRSRQ
jgi:hypothetical protein